MDTCAHMHMHEYIYTGTIIHSLGIGIGFKPRSFYLRPRPGSKTRKWQNGMGESKIKLSTSVQDESDREVTFVYGRFWLTGTKA